MNQELLKEQVDKLNKENEEFILNGVFTLNKKINENNRKLMQYQLVCEHEFVDGKCKYCGLEE